MKRILSIFIVLFLAVAFSIAGGVLLATDNQDQEIENNIAVLPTLGVYSWTLYGYNTITLNVNGGSGGTAVIYNASVGDMVYKKGQLANLIGSGRMWLNTTGTSSADPFASPITKPTRTNYTFAGYYTSSSGGTQTIDADGKITASTSTYTSNATWYAHWTYSAPQSYTLYFNANGGSVSTSSKSVTQGNTYGTLPTPTRTGYTFDGWYTAASGGSQVSASTTMGSANTTIYAHWTIKSFYVTVIKGNYGVSDITNPATSWNYNDGRDGKRISVNYGASQTISASVDAGYSFSHWEGDSSSTSSSITCTVSEEKDYTFVAYAKPNTYILSFDSPNLWDGYGCSTASASANFSQSVDHHGQMYTYCDITEESGGGVYFHKQRLTVGERYVWSIHIRSTRDHQIREIGHEQGGLTSIYVTQEWKSYVHEFVATDNQYEAFVIYGGHQAGDRIEIANLNIQKKSEVPCVNDYGSLKKTYNDTYNYLPTPTRDNYTFDGWWTAPNGGTQITSSSTYNIAGDQTLYSHWTPNTITNHINLMMISKDGNTVTSSNVGGNIDLFRYFINNNVSVSGTYNQTATTLEHVVHQGQLFQITANANSGYVFAGFSTSSTPSASIKNPSAPVSTTASYYPTSGTSYYVYFKQLSGNLLQYDETDKYFYFEDGYYPQSRATNEGTLNSSANATGEVINYNNGTSNVELPVYSYGSDRYVKVTKNGTSAWFKFEPIRWRISDYGVAKTERNISRYTTLLKFQNYTSYATNFTAVSDLILGVGAMHNTRETKEGTSVTSMAGYQNVRDTLESCSISFGYMKSDNIIKVDNYATAPQNNVINKTDVAYTSPFRIASLSEIENVGFANKQARASDMVAFILGVDKNNASYWTRDLSNLGSGVAITASGTQTRPWLNEVLGMRFAYTFSEGSNIGFYS